MINFVWPPTQKLPAGTGGSENYTIGQIRELIRRGEPARVVTIGVGEDDGRDEFTDIPFLSLETLDQVSQLDGEVVLINEPHDIQTAQKAYVIFHIPPPIAEKLRPFYVHGAKNRYLIATSQFGAGIWSDFLPVPRDNVHVAYPFAEPNFAVQKRPKNTSGKIRILYAGRLSPEKGIYSFLEMMHFETICDNPDLIFTVTTAGADKPQGKIIEALVKAHPLLNVVPARKTPQAMAELMSEQDIVVMPSNSQYWHETFGIVSIEAQHSGCWVVASDDGGLPETDCGGLILIKPDDAQALAAGINQAIDHGPRSAKERAASTQFFTVEQSVDNLLKVLASAHN